MKKMYVKQVKKKCSVRGCKNIDCFAVSRTREVGNTVIICKDCLQTAISAIGEINPKTKSNIPSVDFGATPPPLFFNLKASGETASAITEDSTSLSDEKAEVKCYICGKEFAGEKGLKQHLRHCKAENQGAEIK